MHKIIFLLLTLFLVSQQTIAYAKEGSTTSQEELNVFYQEMQKEIEIAEQRVITLLEKIQQHDEIISDIIRLEVEIATTMLKVKQLLAANFAGTESLHNPLIRDKLLSILKKEIITEIDLLELQFLVKVET